MTKVLLVYGEDDLGAMLFSQEGELTLQEAFDKAKENGGRYEDTVGEHGEVVIYKSYEFEGEVSDDFLMFVREEIQDYDVMKDKNFYVIR